MNKYKLLIFSTLITITACVSVESNNNSETILETIEIEVVDENKIFNDYLNDDWEKNLNENPLFATYTGDKRSNNKINSRILSEKVGANKGKLIPTDIGSIVNDFLVSTFKNIL